MSTTTNKQIASALLVPHAGRLWRLLAIFSLLIANLVFAPAAFSQNPSPEPVTTARVMTDTSDYAPGSTATIFGLGFQPGETVTLQVLHADGTPATGQDHDPWTVTADILGGVNTTWHVCEDDCLGSILKLMAVGQSSSLWAATWFTDAEAPANLSACGTTLMDRTTNDGSFESNPVYHINFSPTSLPPVWNITSTGPGIGGLLSNPPHNQVLAGADGSSGLFADGYSPNTTTATSYNLLGGAYTTVSVGDIFTWSFMVNAYGSNGAATLKLNFGAGDITVGTGISGDNNLSAFRTYSGTYIATAADAAGSLLSVRFSITNAQGDNVYGDNIILKVLPVGLPDGDGDGVPDVCDICPDIPNPAQDNQAACIAVTAASATCLESQIHLNNANQAGDVSIKTGIVPTSIRFDFLATCGADLLEFYVNGILIGSTTANTANQCTCGAPLQSLTVSDVGLIASAWNIIGNNTFRVIKSGSSTYLAWVQAHLQAGATTETKCVYNYGTKSCGDMNLCGPHSRIPVDESRTIAESFGVVPVLVTPYTNGQLPQEIDISTLADGQYQLCVSTTGTIESIRFEILNTKCAGSGTYQFFLNSVPIGSVALDPTGSCTCGPALQTFMVTNPALLANWNGSSNNTLSFTLSGTTSFTGYLSWVRATVTRGLESAGAVLFDYAGGNADVYDLCSADFTSGMLTGSANVSLATTNEDCVSFTKAGQDRIVINGLCNQAPVAVCQNIKISANASSQGIAAAEDFDGGSTDPENDQMTFSVSPAGPYPLGVTNVTLTVTDPSNASDQCSATITVCDLAVSLGNNRYVFFGIPGSPGASSDLTAAISGGSTGVTYAWSSSDPSSNVNGSTTQSVTPVGYTDAQAITYTVIATDPNGCADTASVTITYFNINCSNNGNNVKVKVCHIPQGNPTNCNTICVSINAYQTLLDNGSYLGQCLPNCALPPQARGGVVDISDYIVGKQTLDVKVFNNPTQSNFRLYVYGDLYQKVSIRVMDMYGKVFTQMDNLNTEQEIRVGDSYIAGVYMVEVSQGNNRKVVKLVKQ